jgi:hypothetical protein
MMPAEFRDRRRTMRYRHLVVKQVVQMKNRVSGLLMETGVEYSKQRLHKVDHFREMLHQRGGSSQRLSGLPVTRARSPRG